ncbi:MAG: H(+)/Cl(-) exchange transporter ClcA [Chloroflexales bacterium]|nr:H(+)/Cl(-) exchange transporter ClcA [Chloroflexales bacterium]
MSVRQRHQRSPERVSERTDGLDARIAPPVVPQAGGAAAPAPTPQRPDTLAQAEARSELAEYLDRTQQRRHLFPRAALVGLLAGAVAIVFRALLAAGDTLRNGLIAWAHQAPALGWLAPLLFGAVGATLAVALVRRYAPEASGSGIPHTEAVLHRLRELRWRRVLPVKLVGGTVAIGAGLALGREGPTVQMGAAVGAAVAERLSSPTRERLTLIAAGAGAGLAAAFNAPLAGLVFVLEEVQGDFRPAVFGAAFIAAAVADILARLVGGQLPVFTIPSYPVPPLTALPVFVLLGMVSGLVGVLFNRGLLGTLTRFGRLSGRLVLVAAGLVGATAGLVGWFVPTLVGGGHDLTETVLVGGVALAAIPLLFALRFGLTLVSYGTGAPGGIFAPLLALGALLGLAIGDLAHLVAPAAVPQPAVFAVVGMAAYFTAIVRAPLTGIVLIVEMTGNYNQMLPLLVACFGAYAVAELLGDLPIYEALLQRDLRRSGVAHAVHAPMVLELEVEPGAPFAGRTIRELGLPPGCIIVRCRDGGREWVPTAATRLEPHMRLTAMIAPEAEAGLRALRDGCEEESSV